MAGNPGSVTNTFSIFKWVMSRLFTLDQPTLESLHFYFRRFLHVMCYGILTVLWFRALMASHPGRPGANRLLALAVTLLVATPDEGRQYLSPGRTPSWWDIGLDLSGGLLFLSLSTCYGARKNRLPAEAGSLPP
jgi:VanZ family protein